MKTWKKLSIPLIVLAVSLVLIIYFFTSVAFPPMEPVGGPPSSNERLQINNVQVNGSTMSFDVQSINHSASFKLDSRLTNVIIQDDLGNLVKDQPLNCTIPFTENKSISINVALKSGNYSMRVLTAYGAVFVPIPNIITVP